MSKTLRGLATVTVSCGLGACGGGGGDNTFGGIHCAGLTGATPMHSVQCNGGTCSVDFDDAAMDHDLNTHAIMSLNPNANGSVTLRATAQDGVTYAAGTPAAVIYGVSRTSGNSLGTAETISTYLNGVLQETGNAGPTNGSTDSNEPAERRAFTTTLAFDAIELKYVQSGGTANVDIPVYEFCTSVD